MAEIVLETGEGVGNANSYVSVGQTTAYLWQRGNLDVWNNASQDDRSSACINATAYIDKVWGQRFKGRKEFLDLARSSWSVLQMLQEGSGNNITIDGTTYLFRTSTPTNAYDVFSGGTPQASAENLDAAINDSEPGSGKYGPGTVEHPTCSSLWTDGDSVYVSADDPGEAGNDIVTISSNETRAVWANGTLLYGSDGEEQPLEFPRINLYTRAGQLVDGMPLQLLQATSEYAVRYLEALETILPDPVIDPTGRAVTEQSEKVGPIETTTKWTDNDAIANIIRPYPEADKLLQEYLFPLGRVFRG